jgi:hypothetical protein
MITNFSPAELQRLSQLFFTDLPVRATKIKDTGVRAAVESVACAAVELGLDVFFPKAWQQLAYLGAQLEKKDKTSIEEILTQRLLAHFITFATHSRLVHEMMVTYSSIALTLPFAYLSLLTPFIDHNRYWSKPI